jgi:hypothetical protein
MAILRSLLGYLKVFIPSDGRVSIGASIKASARRRNRAKFGLPTAGKGHFLDYPSPSH